MKSSGNPPPSLLKFCLLMLMLVSYTDTFVIGAPKGGHVVSGTASFTQDGNLTVITAGNRSVINYTGFDIGKNETVQFVQPSAHSTVLNRVTTPDPTNIFGQLQSNGIVVISNPYGVFFQNGSVVNVGGLIAGAGKISDADFSAGKIHFTDLKGDVRNDGVIAADNRIALLGANVANTGSMTAAHGVAMMVSGPDVYVGDKNGNVFVQANGKALKAAAAATTGTAASAGSVANSGTVKAPRVILGAGDMYSTAIVNSGLLQGRSIAVNAGKSGSATVGGTLDASSARNPAPSGRGGDINVLGGKVALQGAKLDASGRAGGGNVRIGGDFHGAGTLAHADTVVVDAATTINADATGPTGDGGTVVLWSDTGTYFGGTISARGGSAGGSGGSAEVSSHNQLIYRGFANLTALAGKTGELLLDPSNITISNDAAADYTISAANPTVLFGGGNTPPTPPGGTPANTAITIGAGALGTALLTADVKLQANNSIFVNQSVTAATGTRNLTLNAGNSISFANNVTITLGGMFIATFNDGGADATIRVQTNPITPATFTMGTGTTITAPGGVSITSDTFQGGAASIGANVGLVTLNNVTAHGGNITVNNGGGVGGILVNGTLDASGSVTTPAGGVIALTSSGDVTTGAVTASGQANILVPGTFSGLAGSVTVNAGGNVDLASVNTDGSTGGLVGVTAGGTLGIGPLSAVGTGAAPGTTVGNGGAVTLSSKGALTPGPIVTTSTNGTGGAVSLTVADNSPATTAVVLALPTINTQGAKGGGAVTALNNNKNAGSNLTDANALNTTGTGTNAVGGNVRLATAAGNLTLGSTVTTSGAGTGAAGTVQLTAAGGTLSSGAITATGATGAGGNVTLNGTGAMTLGNITTSGASAGNILVGATTAPTSIGGSPALKALASTGAGGTVSLTAAGAITTGDISTAGVTANGNVSLLSAATTATAGAFTTGNINTSFDPADAAKTMNAAGGTIAIGAPAVAGNARPTSITVGTLNTGGNDAAAITDDGTITLQTSGAITFPTGANTLTGNTTLTGASITGVTTVDGAGVVTQGTTSFDSTGHDLTLNITAAKAVGTPIIGGNPGTPTYTGIRNFQSNGTGGSIIVGDFSTTGTQSYNGPVTLNVDATLTATNNSAVGFVSTVDGAHALTVTTGGTTTFGNNVGGTTNLTSLNVSNGPTSFTPTTAGAALAVTTSAVGGQNYNGAVTLGADTTLTAAANGPVKFVSTVDGAHALTVATGGLTTFGGIVGGGTGTALTSLNVSNGGTSFTPTVAGATSAVTTTGTDAVTTNGQTYHGAVTLGADTTLNAGTKPVGFVSTVNGAQALKVTTTGVTTFGDNVGGTTNLTNLTSLDVSSGGTSFTPTTAGAALAVTTSAVGGQNFNGAVTLGTDTTLTALANGPVVFGSTINGGFALTIATGGLAKFGGDVGLTAALTSLKSTGAGGVTFTNPLTVKTSGVQGYTGLLTLGGTTVLTSTGSTVTVGSLAGGGFGLTVNATALAGVAASDFGTITNGGALIFNDGTGVASFSGDIGAVSLSSTGAGGATFTTAETVTTSGAAGQSYTGTLTLGGTTTLTANGTGTVTAGPVTGGGFDLTVNAKGSSFGAITNGGALVFNDGTGTAVFNGAVDAVSLATTGTGVATLKGDVTTSGISGQSYGNPVLLSPATGTTTTLTANGGGPITFGSTVGGSAATVALSLVTTAVLPATPGIITFGGAVGPAGSPLASLTTSTGSPVHINGGAVTTSGAQTYGGIITLGSTATTPLTVLTGGTLTTGILINGGGTQSLTLNFTNALTLQNGTTATAGFITLNDINNLTSSGTGGTRLGGTLLTEGNQNFANVVTLTANTILTSNNGTVSANSVTGGGFDLTVNATGSTFGPITNGGALVFADGTGVANFSGNISATSLSSTGSGGVTFTAPLTVQTSGAQGYTGLLTLGGATTLTSTGSTVTAGSLAGGGFNLTVNATAAAGANASTFGTITNGGVLVFNDDTGVASFSGNIGATSLSSTGTGGVTFTNPLTVTTSGLQNYAGTLTLGGTTTLTSTGSTVTAGPLTGGGFNLTVNSKGSSFGTITNGGALTFADGTGVATFTGNIGAVSLSSTGTGGVTFTNPETVTTSGVAGQNYTGKLTLGGTTTLTANGGGTVTAGSLAGGGFGLTVNAAGSTFGAITNGGALVFNDGTSTATFTGNIGAASLNSTGTGGVTFSNGLSVTTTGTQDYTGTLTLGGGTTLTGTTITAGPVTGNANALTVTASTGASFGAITGAGALIFNGTGSTALTGAITAASLSVSNGTGVALSGGTVTTSAGQQYSEAVTLGANTTLASTVNGNIAFTSTVKSTGGARTLTVNTGGVTTFGGAVGGGAGTLASVTTDAAGSTQLNGGTVDTTGAQTYNDTVTLGATTTLTSTASGDIKFGKTLDSDAITTPRALTVNTSGTTIFNGLAGGIAPLASVTTDMPGFTQINGGVITTGAQMYGDPVSLLGDSTLQGTTLSFPSFTGNNHDLTLTFSSLVTANGFTDIHNFTSNGGGGTDIIGSFGTSGFQHYVNAVTLSGNATLTAGVIANQDSISFGQTVDSANHFALTLATSGPIKFGGIVGGGTNALGSLVTLGTGKTFLNGSAVTTVGNQTFAGPVVLGPTGHQTTLTSTSSGTIKFSSTLDGDTAALQSLTTSTSGAVEFDAAVGTTPLQSLTANGTGTTTIKGGSVTTTGGGQNYKGPVVIDTAATTTLSDSTTGDLTFGSTLNNSLAGTPALNLSTGGDITFKGQVGNSGALGNLTASAGGTTFVNGGLVRSSGFQVYNQPNPLLLGKVSLGNTATFTSTSGGNIQFHATVDGTTAGAQGLTVNTTGNEIFDGVVGGIALASLTTDGGAGTTQFNMPIGGTAAAGVHVTGDVTIGDAVLFASTGSSFAQPSVLSGGSQSYSSGSATQNVFLVGGGTFGSTGTLDFGGTHDLSIRFGAQATVPGGLANVRNFLTDGAGGTLVNGTFTTTGTQTYSDAVTLAGAPILTSVGNLTFNNPVDGNAPLTLNATGTGAQVVFTANALVGNTTSVGTLTTNSVGGTVFGMDAGNITIATGKGGLNAGSVTVASGPVFFNVANATSAHPSILTTGAQSYQGAGTLQQNTILQSSVGGGISFGTAATLDSPLTPAPLRSLTLVTTGTQTFSGLIGSITPLSGLTTGTGPTVFNMDVGTAMAGVRVNGPLTTGGAVSFNELGSSLTQPSVLTLGNGAQTYGGVVTLLGDVTVLNSANTEPVTGTFTGGGVITFKDNIVSGVPVNAMNGTPRLDVRAGVGMVEFDAPITTTGDFEPGGATVIFKGSIGPIGTFTVLPNDLNATGGSIDLNGGSIITGGSQAFRLPTVLSADTTLQAGGNILFASTLDGSNLLTNAPYKLDVGVNGGTIAFNGLVGSTVPLQSLTTRNLGATFGTTQFNMVLPLAIAGISGVNVIGAVKIGTNADFEAVGLAGGKVPTIRSGVTYLGQVGTGTQTYGGAVTLGLSSILHQTTVLQDIAVAGDITFNGRINGKVDGDAGLSVNSKGDEIFNQLVGTAQVAANSHPLASLSTDDVSGGTGSTRFNMDLTQTGAAAGVRVAGTVNVNDRVSFNAIGGLVRPTILSGGAQNYALDATVNRGTVLTIDPALRTAGLPADNGHVVFQSRVDSGATAQDLQVNSPGNEIFKGLVGYASPLASLTTDATGPRTGQTRFVMTAIPGSALQNNLGGVNVNGNVTVNDGAFFQVANSFSLSSGLNYTPSVISGGTQTYVGPASLGNTTVLASTNGNVAFQSTVDSETLATPQPLTIVTTAAGSAITFAQAVGGTFPLASLTTAGAGTTQINGGLVSTVGGQRYDQAVTLGQDTTLFATDPTNGSISFNNSLDGNRNLTINAPVVNLRTVGNTSPLLNLTINAPSGANFNYVSGVTPGNGAVNLAGRLTVNGPATFRAANAGNVVFVRTGVTVPGFNLASGQDYLGAVRLQGTATFTDLKSGPISFRQTVDGFATGNPSDLTVSTGGTISFLGSVGAVTPLTSLTTSNLGLASGQTVISGGSVTTMVGTGPANGTGAQTYNDAVVLGAGTTLTSLPGTATVGGDIAFTSTLNSNGVATPQALVVNTSGRTVFGGAVGAINALASLTTDNEGAQDLGTGINGGSVTTTGAQTYNDAATLGAATTLTSTAGGRVAFTSTLNSNGVATPQALVVNTSGRTVFGGAVGAINALASLTTDNEGAQDLGTGINGGSVTTTGAQTYNDGVSIGAATTLTSTAGGDVAFNSTLDSNGTTTPQTLTINTSGRTVFGGAVGAINALASLTTDNEGAQDLGTFLNGGSVTTAGAQTYNDAATLGANATLASRANGTLVFNGTVNGPFTLALNTGGLTIFNRVVGNVTPLKGLITDNAGVAGEATQFNMTVGNSAAGVVVNGPITINDAVLFNVKGSSLTQPGILTLGNAFSQTFNGQAKLGTSTFLVSASAASTGGVFTGGGSVIFNSPQGIVANGGNDLTVRAGVGTDTLTAAVNVGTLDLGGASAIFRGPITLPGLLSVEPNDATGGGSIAFTGATLTTSGAQLYNAAFVLNSDSVLISTAGGSITFASTVDGTHALTVNTSGNEVFNGRVGGITPLLSLTTDNPAAGVSGGRVVFNVAGSTTAAPSVTTTGFQIYNDAAILRADTVLASTGGGSLTFASTVNSFTTDAPRFLTLNTSGDSIFNGQVGGVAPLLSLTTNDPAASLAGGRTFFNLTGTTPTTPTVTTTGFQAYNNAVIVQTGTTLTSTGGGALTFGSTVDGPASLTLDTAGQTTFQGAVGGGTSLASLTTQGGGGVAINGRIVTTTGLQTYGGVTTLGADTVLTSTATGGGISFGTTLDSDTKTTARTLTLNAVGDETFNGRVGGNAPLASLTTDDPAAGVSGGRVVFNIGGMPGVPSVTTTGAQTYNDAALLQAATILGSTAGGTLTFNSTVDGTFDLTLNTTGNEVFGGTVGGKQALASLTTDTTSVGGQVIFGLPGASAALSVTTTGAQLYNDAVLLQTGVTLASMMGGNLTFASTVDGPFALTLNSKGDEVFNKQIGGKIALASLSTDADTKNAGGNVRFFFTGTNASPSVTTTGPQAYRDAATLHADTVLASTSGGRLAFLSTVDNNNVANPHALTLNSSGDELFGGLIGAGKAIGNLATDAAGTVGGQALFAVDLTGQTGNNAGVRVNGSVTINDAVTFNAPGASARNVLVQSTGPQVYNGAATVGADAVLASPGGGVLTFNSTVVGPGGLTLNTSGPMTFNGAVGSGAGNALGSLTTQGGAVVLNAGSVTTTGAQDYSGAVTLAQDTLLTSNAGGINFGSAVDGTFALTLATADATSFNGAVGGIDPLTRLTTADGSGVIVNGGLVATLGLQTYGGQVTVNGPGDGTTILRATNTEAGSDVTQHGNIDFRQDVTVNSGSLLVQGRRILAETNADISVAGAGNLDLEASTVLILRGANYGSDRGSVTLNDPHNGVDPAAVNNTTIFLTNPRTTFHGGSFDMGYLQNMFSQGSVFINVGNGTATLSDIAANGSIGVTAGNIVLRARNADITRGGGTGGGIDNGLNFVARTSINFGNSPIRYDNTYSNNNVANFVTTGGQVTVNRDRAVGISLFQNASLAADFARLNGGINFNDANFGSFSGFPLQPISGGTQTIDTAAALSGALPDQKPLDVAVDITVTAGQLEELKKLGIHPRRAAKQERLSLNSKRALFAQLVDGQDQENYGLLQPIKGGVSRLVPSDYVVVVDRMSEREVQSILTAFEELYGKNKEKAAPIGESFNTAFTDYTTEKQTGDPAGFAPYLVEKPGKYPDVDKAVRGFDNLFGYIESLGLTSKEQAKSKEHIASDLQVAGVSPEDMVKVIDTLRSKIPKDQKASSTKLPPSPPVAAPAPGATNPPKPAVKPTPPLKTARQPAKDPARKTVRQAKPVKEDRLHEVAGL